MYLFDYNYNLLDFKDILNIKKILKLKDLYILDYGCGKGIWEKNQLKKIKELILYDVNKELTSLLYQKYKSCKNIHINFEKKFLFKKRINLIILSSVIQYMNNTQIENFLKKIKKKYKNKKISIFINDHPLQFRIIELIFLPFMNLKKFFESLKLIVKIRYIKTRYFKHNIKKNNYIKKNFFIKDLGYVENMKYLRGKYLLILKND